MARVEAIREEPSQTHGEGQRSWMILDCTALHWTGSSCLLATTFSLALFLRHLRTPIYHLFYINSELYLSPFRPRGVPCRRPIIVALCANTTMTNGESERTSNMTDRQRGRSEVMTPCKW
jgi:hypothetical protein